AGRPVEGWLWPAPTLSGHIDHSSLKKQHIRAVRLSKVRPFVLYDFRHTFLTRLGALRDTVRLRFPAAMFTRPKMQCWLPFLGWVGTKLGTVQKVRKSAGCQ